MTEHPSHVEDDRGGNSLIGFDEVRTDSLDFYFPVDNSQARYIEVWMLKKKTQGSKNPMSLF